MSGEEDFSDELLQAAFEARTLPQACWTHRAHVRMAFLYVSQHPLDQAIDRMRAGIQGYNAANQVPEALDRGYHETITVAFLRLIHAAVAATGPYVSSAPFCQRHPELLDKFVLRKYYSRPQIMTLEAKARFVEPDLTPLPPVTVACTTRCGAVS